MVFRDPDGWLPVTTKPQRPPLVEATDWVLSLVGLSTPEPVPYDTTVPEGSLWVLGDNRNSSKDSRYNPPERAAAAVRAGVASVLTGQRGIVLWMN